ncbi:MAG: carbohydrate ABC transporter permease [Spirochaetaceae bacterium]|jgi:multiple sugar transport system permease protein|nr:carbohydrate ABC transporter permease [Spirochaetaceae bacterium]
MIEKRNYITRLGVYVLLAAITVIALLPFIWMLSSALKHDVDVFAVPIQWIPKNPVWSNYSVIWGKINFALFIFNSFKLSIIVTVIQLFTSAFAAYGFAKCRFPGRDTLFFFYIATIAIPWQVYMLPQYTEMRILHLTNTHLGYVFMHCFTAFGVFLVRQFYQSIPDELLDAARIDGLNEYGSFFHIMLPLSKPVLATLTIFTFVNVWNDFMGPLIYFDSERLKTIPLGIRMFMGVYSTEYGLIMAASVVSLVPVFIVFALFQRFFVEGVANTGLKG